ncbi:MAG: hypothetical protein OHK93_000566 [Ramalina farinacea]|uniref:Dienelactone hydrolase domain-containing protein n=1 Tax=Ramalina farinacea TaxID=258253 RepID=A0AA43QF56_9LECA|nr:hypothetical protein [Ramalina farinacea]
MASSGPSKACCTVPPAKVEDYSPKGKYIKLSDGMECYATGPSSATTAIFVVYDIFGFSPQGIQGADILAHADDGSHQYRVFVPDFFYGKPMDHANYPPDTPEKQKKLGDFFAGPAAPKPTAEKVPALVKDILGLAEGKGVTKWGALGQCWGGKEVHPAMVDANDAKAIKIPYAMLASKDEDAKLVKEFGDALTGPKYLETFGDQIHGWMAARADLKQDRVRQEYERGYKTLLEFYHEHL